MLNVWASWCVPCHDEAPLLVKLAADQRIRVVGINYKDQPDNARRFLGRYGNPFVAIGVDPNGRAAIEWGVYGVPETFVVGRDGRIAYKLIGPITRGESGNGGEAGDREGAGGSIASIDRAAMRDSLLHVRYSRFRCGVFLQQRKLRDARTGRSAAPRRTP